MVNTKAEAHSGSGTELTVLVLRDSFSRRVDILNTFSSCKRLKSSSGFSRTAPAEKMLTEDRDE